MLEVNSDLWKNCLYAKHHQTHHCAALQSSSTKTVIQRSTNQNRSFSPPQAFQTRAELKHQGVLDLDW